MFQMGAHTVCWYGGRLSPTNKQNRTVVTSNDDHMPQSAPLHSISLTLASCPMGNEGSFPWEKVAGAQADHSSAPHAKVNSSYDYISVQPYASMPCTDTPLLFLPSLKYVSLYSRIKWVIILCHECLLSLPALLVGFQEGHMNMTSADRKQITMFVRYNNGRILPWRISVFGGALFRNRSASRPPKGAAPLITWRSDCRYLGSTPGCEARNSTSGGAAYSTVACRKRESGKGKGTVHPVTYHEGTEGVAVYLHQTVQHS